MEYYAILGKPMAYNESICYKGLHRMEPSWSEKADARIIELLTKYVQYYENAMGITTELSLDELHELANWYSINLEEAYELIYFTDESTYPCEAFYYGIDVVGYGGYSMLGEGLFRNPHDDANSTYYLLDVVNQYFAAKLNQNGLFYSMEDAISFRGVLKEWEGIFPGFIEKEDWKIVHIFSVG